MGGYYVDVSSLMAKWSVIVDVARTQTKMVERLRCQEEEAARFHENVQRDRQLLTNLINCVDKQSRVIDAVWEHQESIPRIASSLVTPSVQASNSSKNSKPPSLLIFLGDVPMPHGEAEFQVCSFRESYTNEAIKNAVIANCRG